MGFLSGSAGYECFRTCTSDSPLRHFGPEHVETLEKFAIGSKQKLTADQSRVGLLAGEHLFDRDFDLAKNILNDALHFAMRIDTNQIPAAVRKAWLQMELAVFKAESPDRRLTKAERQEAKDAVEGRCEEAARTGQFVKMQQFPILWDARFGQVYFGGSSPSASEACRMLLKRPLNLSWNRSQPGNWPWSGPPKRDVAEHLMMSHRQDFAARRRLLRSNGGVVRRTTTISSATSSCSGCGGTGKHSRTELNCPMGPKWSACSCAL